MPYPTLVLASASVARRRLLHQAGLTFHVCPSQFDEDAVTITDPAELVNTLALGKATAIANRIRNGEIPDIDTHCLVLGCDSVLAFGGEIHGKPDSPEVAIARWQRMRGRVGDLCTGHALLDLAQDQQLVCCRVTQVYFADITDQQIETYVATGEPMACAGGFAIEGMGGFFVEKLDGCHTNVIGLSLPLFRQMLAELGYDITQFWQQRHL
ncbi:MAG: Maf-like protein [Cyanobacteria bacterium]|nr:Maf-like protein [Cyanobacteriota bacterium]MDW8201083.1 nucleoside triphosphate pyrophosphatase [Cyanobacteriota bacterium SKYGB_h_bin112]